MGTFGPGEEDRIGYVVSVGVKQDEPPKTEKCATCGKSVYAAERMEAGGNVYHKLCFKCATCKMPLKLNNYQQNEGKLLCKTDYQKEILAKNAQICT
ncbi:hypothetical protein LSH36_68g11000 [Paralvinella palmiformis]|uniref:LIM zinc-binding domain-containing protein n=1 Tax=Paralvinella palmiformis TaxID=53620 RepID=A0AAD9NDE5_9ANNE|nr:hypothetical protein LSH36_68g11000 [Paralvinella palmiformis]